MLTIIKAAVLGILQGITEWLPVSSSGHLVIFQRLFALDVPVLFDVLLHVGTLVAVLLVFYKDIWKMICAVFRLDFKSVYGKLALFIIIGSIPTAIIGFTFRDLFESFFSNLLIVGIALLFTGFFLLLTKRLSGKKKLSCGSSFVIGIAQGIAIIPGISRSGSTICMAMLLGIKKESAAKFSFLLALPAIIGAAIFEASNVALLKGQMPAVVIGVLLSAMVGYLCIKWLLSIISKSKFYLFSYYCFTAGLISIILYLVGF